MSVPGLPFPKQSRWPPLYVTVMFLTDVSTQQTQKAPAKTPAKSEPGRLGVSAA